MLSLCIIIRSIARYPGLHQRIDGWAGRPAEMGLATDTLPLKIPLSTAKTLNTECSSNKSMDHRNNPAHARGARHIRPPDLAALNPDHRCTIGNTTSTNMPEICFSIFYSPDFRAQLNVHLRLQSPIGMQIRGKAHPLSVVIF